MLSPSDSLPFLLDPNMADYSQGIFEIRGLLKYRDQTLVLEYRGEGMEELGLTDSSNRRDVQTIELPLRDVRAIELKRSILGARLIIEANSLSAFDGVPGSDHDRLVLRIPWKHRKAADPFASYLRAELAELKLGDV